MDNITHAFVGAAIAEIALPRPASVETHKVFMVAAVAAASAPDIDLVYTWITEAPIGYLLHHRGHSHTWPGLAVLGVVMLAALRCWPAAWRVAQAEPPRLASVLSLALASHLLLDAGNSYGTHLFYPLTSRWYYGDAVFIFEPWLWLLLGAAVALNAQRAWTRRLTWALTAVLPFVLLAAGLVSASVFAALAAGGVAMAVVLSRQLAHVRARVALGGTVALFVGMFGISHVVKAATSAALPSASTSIVDVVANPNPGVPWCWSIVTIERAADHALLVRRGTMSLLPRVSRAGDCASHRLMAEATPEAPIERRGASPGSAAVLWNREWYVDLAQLDAVAADCHVAAWLQFGRVPFVDNGAIVDLRFDNPVSDNFSAMRLDRQASGRCPSNLTNWTWPRADVVLALPR